MPIQIIRTTTVILLVTLAGAAGGDESPVAQPGASADIPADGSADWAQTKLKPEPALREQYNRTRAFLDDRLSDVDGQISRLKTEGVIDRRSATKIRSALNNARVSMTGMAGGMQENKEVDGWTARMFAFELGMAADTLTREAERIEANLDSNKIGKDEKEEERPSEPDQQRHLAHTLKETGSLLRSTAKAITANLK
jgi:hypothetical protein